MTLVCPPQSILEQLALRHHPFFHESGQHAARQLRAVLAVGCELDAALRDGLPALLDDLAAPDLDPAYAGIRAMVAARVPEDERESGLAPRCLPVERQHRAMAGLVADAAQDLLAEVQAVLDRECALAARVAACCVLTSALVEISELVHPMLRASSSWEIRRDEFERCRREATHDIPALLPAADKPGFVRGVEVMQAAFWGYFDLLERLGRPRAAVA